MTLFTDIFQRGSKLPPKERAYLQGKVGVYFGNPEMMSFYFKLMDKRELMRKVK